MTVYLKVINSNHRPLKDDDGDAMRAIAKTKSVELNIAVLNAGSMLLIEQSNKRGLGKYRLVGGSKQKGETERSAVCRIVESELGLKITSDRLEFLSDYNTWLLKIENKEYNTIPRSKRAFLATPEAVNTARDVRPTIKKIARYIMTKFTSNKIL